MEPQSTLKTNIIDKEELWKDFPLETGSPATPALAGTDTRTRAWAWSQPQHQNSEAAEATVPKWQNTEPLTTGQVTFQIANEKTDRLMKSLR